MSLQNIHLINFRNIGQARLDLSPTFNYLYGNNGAGKTSLLEAIYCLGLGRSFRNKSPNVAISHVSDSFFLRGEVGIERGGALSSTSVLYKKHRSGERSLTIDGSKVKSFLDVANLLPIQFIGVDTNKLFSAGSSYRRRFLDWGVFHVEHSFYDQWRDYSKLLKQRNFLLKGKPARLDLKVWDHAMSPLAMSMDEHRRCYSARLSQSVASIWSGFGFSGLLEIKYKRGWATGSDLVSILGCNYLNDLRYGYTVSGPHRADFKIVYDGRLVDEVLSQGQLKLLSYILRLSQGIIMFELLNKAPLYMIDDLPSEFDDSAMQQIFELLDTLKAQVIVTAVSAGLSCNMKNIANDLTMFHVEHGVIK